MYQENANVMLKQIEGQLNELKSQYAEKVEPVEKVIAEHPIPSVLIGVGIGILIGVLSYKFKK